ncbi:MAG: hypothetical protein PVJ89_08840 [Planctomycetota bacterium]|jgi:hypothetical protein
MTHRFSEKTAPVALVRVEDGPQVKGCVVDAAFARLDVRFEGPNPPALPITGAVSMSFSSNGSIEGVEAPGRVIERRELDSARLYVIQVPPEIARQVLQSEGLRGDYRLNTLRHQGVSARLRVAGGDWGKVLLKNLSVSGAAVLLSPQAEGALAGHEEVELELGLDGEWSAVLRTRILQRRLEGPRVSCGVLFDWPSMPGSAETERELRAWLQREQLRTRARRSA